MKIHELECIIDRYLAGSATPEEKAFVAQWLAPKEDDIAVLNKHAHQLIKTDLWQAICVGIGIAAKATGERKGVLYHIKRQRHWLQYAAAVIVVMIGSAVLYTAMQKKQATAPHIITATAGSQKVFTLPDSSKVYLFPGTSLSLPDNYNQKERIITLTGKAFFEVKPDASRPFLVRSGRLLTSVLGTSFEVMEIDSTHASIIVRDGKVSVQSSGRHLSTLTAGKRLRYDMRQNDFVTDDVNAVALCEWWNNGLAFHQASLQEIVHDLSNWYNTPITITGDKWNEEPVTIRFKDHSLPQAMTLLSQTLGFRFRHSGKAIIIY